MSLSPSAAEHKSLLVYHPNFLHYDFGPQHPLRPERITASLDLLASVGIWDIREDVLLPSPATGEELQLLHDSAYIHAVQEASTGWFPAHELVQYGLHSGDNPAFPGMHDAAAYVAGGSIEAMRCIMTGTLDHAFNPAGGLHHASRARASGFCIYNDPALAAAVAIEEFGARVLYIDLDCHHGDGVQWLFYDDPRVLTISFHESGRYLFPGTGGVHEVGEGSGKGFSVNVPMAPFTQDSSWLDAVNVVLPSLTEQFAPDLIISAHGADTHVWDPLTHLALTTRSFVEQARLVHELAHHYTSGRWLAVGSGGYDWRRVVPRSWAIVWSEMTGRALAPDLPSEWISRWEAGADGPVPGTMSDDASLETPISRAQEVAEINRATVHSVLELAHVKPAYLP